MKLELKPEILEVVKRQGVTPTNAGLSRDGQISWIYKEGFLEVALSHTNEILATWRFGKVLKDVHTTITCVTDLTFCGDYLLVVATTSLTNQGTVNIFSVGLRKVIRAIEVPQRVTALDVVYTNVNEDVPCWILSKHLQFFSGLVAVGTEGGYIYLVDLCLDELTGNHSTEALPKKMTVISPGIVDPKARREQARLYDRHLAMLLDDQCHRQGHFYYRRQDDTVQKVLDEDAVTVTSIKYLNQAGTLAVGFNFGSFQLWRLYNPVLDYSSRFSPDGVAVSHFVVQEPENDPRNFVYLWVGHDDSAGDSVSSICLYQLCFTRKNVYASFGMHYDELESVCARLDHKLTLDPYSSDTKATRSSSIVSCYTIVNPYFTPPSKLSDSFEEGLHSSDLSLSMFVWRAVGKRAGGAVKHWLCIFDLNRWYHAQMPHALRCHGNSLQVCSYWVACNLDEVASLISSSASLLGVGLSGDKVLRFINNSPLPPEEHSYPSALQLTSIQFITSDSCIRARCDGWQGQLLCQLAHNGAQILVQPAEFYHQCHRARLLPQNYEELKTSTTDYQRIVLLNMALERGITSTLVPQCIQQWADGEFAEHGCTLTFLLDWAWNRVVSIKKSWDSTCEILYDWSGHHLDSGTDWQLECLTESLSNLKQIFAALVAQSSPTTERGEIEMEVRQDVVSILLLHCNVVRWCVSFNLLPEIDEASDFQTGLFPYPINSLRETYTKKRAELISMKGIVKDFSLLLIDDLLDCQGPHIKKMWKTMGGNGLYPPPSIQALVNMYLIEEVSTEVKHAVTLYLLQDLAALTKNEAGEAVIASFIQRFMLSPGLVHQTQGLWFIDHRDFEEGVRHLVNPNIHDDLGGIWKHVAVVNTLLAQSEGKAATRYLHTKGILGGSPQEQQLYISVLLNNRQVCQALEYMRRCQNENNSAHLLDHLLNECHKYKLLGQLLQLNLTDAEEVNLEQYLRGRAEPHALEPLLLYYLHHSRFLQAFQLNEDMKKMDRLETSVVAQERAATRNRLLEAYLNALPDVTRKLLMEKQRGSTSTAKRFEVQRPKPLSAKVHNADLVAMSRSHFVMAVLEKVTEAQNMVTNDTADMAGGDKTNDVIESGSNVPFLSTPRTPRHKMYSRASEVIYPDLMLSPLATNPLSTVKRKVMVDYKDGQLNGNIGLRQLTEECLQLLHTPIRNHKLRSSGSGLAATVSHIKTPQSILKVQRLSKTLFSSSKDKSSARRSSGSRSTRLGFSADISQPATPTNSPSVEKFAASPLLVSTENTAVKQLRFVGVSPSSPTASPTVASESSAERSKEVVAKDTSSSWQPFVRPAETTNSATKVFSEKAFVMAPVSLHENLPEAPVQASFSKRSRIESPSTDVLHLEREHQSFVEGSSDRYSSEFEELIRPDLQSPWKQGQLQGQTEHSPPAQSVKFSPASSVDVSNVSEPTEEEVAMEVVDQSQSGRDSHSSIHTHLVEQVVSSQSSEILTSYSQEVLKTTTRHVQLSVNTELTVAHLQDASRPTKGLRSRINLSPLLASSGHDLRSLKSSSVSPKSLTVEVAETASRITISPPATPPSSKRAKLLESRAKELELFRISRRSTPSPDRSDTDEPRRRKTPVRRSPSRKSEHEELQRKTPERKSPSRSLQKVSVDEEHQRKTPDRKSPSRRVQKLEDRIDEETQRKTPERKSPSRKIQKVEEVRVDELQKKIPERKSPSRKIQKLDDIVNEEIHRKTPERKSPSRKLQKLEEDKFEKDKDVLDKHASSPRSQRRTPERQSVVRKPLKLSESDDDKQIVSGKTEHANLATYKNHRKTYTNIIADDDKEKGEVLRAAEEVVGNISEADTSPEVQGRRRSARLNTPDRALAGSSSLEPLSPARGRGRASRTPQKMSQKHVRDEDMEIEGKQSPSQRSNRRKVSEFSEAVEESKSELSTLTFISGKVVDESVDNARSPGRQSKKRIVEDEESEREVHNLRRSTRQSRTPDRLVTHVDTLEPMTPTRRSQRLPKPSEKLNAVETESVKTSLESSRKMVGKERASPKGHDEPTEKSGPYEAPLTLSKQQTSKLRIPDLSSTEEISAVSQSISQSRSAKIVTTEEKGVEVTSSPSKESEEEKSQEPYLRSHSRKTPDRQLIDTDSEQAEDVAPSTTIARSPGRSRKSRARQTASPARKTRSPARQTKSPDRNTKNRDEDIDDSDTKKENNGYENVDGWSEEMPTLRLEVEDDVDSTDNDRHGVTDVNKTETARQHCESSEGFLLDHKKGPSSTTSEDPLTPLQAQLSKTAKKSSHEEDVTKKLTPNFVFSPPLKHSAQSQDHEKYSLARTDEEHVLEQVFVFSHPTVAVDDDSVGHVEVAEVESESRVKVQEETKQNRKSKKKRTLLAYSPVLLLPQSPVSGRKSQRHRLDSLRVAAGTKLRGPRARRIKPSTWTQPTTSRQ